MEDAVLERRAASCNTGHKLEPNERNEHPGLKLKADLRLVGFWVSFNFHRGRASMISAPKPFVSHKPKSKRANALPPAPAHSGRLVLACGFSEHLVGANDG